MRASQLWTGLIERGRVAAEANRRLLTNAGSMVGTALATAAFGVAFWLVAAHNFDQSAVGVAGAAISAMTLLGFMSALGLGTLLMGELPRREEGRRSLLNAALIVAGIAGTVLGLVFALAAPLASSNLDPLSATPLSVVFYAAGVGLTGLALVLDQALIGMLRGGLQLARNVAFALIKLLALIAVAVFVSDAGADWIYSAWAVGIALSLWVLTGFYVRRGRDRLRPNFRELNEMRGQAASHAAVNLGLETADLAMPILVLMIVSASANAAFYIAWMITNILIMVPLSLSTVAYAIGSGESARLAQRFRFTLGVSLAFAVIANLVLIPMASPVLGVFGESYSDQATGPLHVMALGVFPLIVKTHYVAIQRLQRRLATALPLVWAGTLLELGGGAVGAATGGISGAAWGWLVGLCVEALVMGPTVIRATRAGGAEDAQTEQQEPDLEAVAAFDAATLERF